MQLGHIFYPGYSYAAEHHTAWNSYNITEAWTAMKLESLAMVAWMVTRDYKIEGIDKVS